MTVVPPRSGEPIKPDQVKAVLNLEQRSGGVYSIPIRIIAPDIEINAISPSSVTLTIDQLVDHTFPLAVTYSGVPEGIVVSNVQVDPKTITVRGTATDLAKIQAIRVDIPVGTVSATFDEMVRPSANAPGVDPSTLVLSPNLVRVRAVFSRGQSAK
ncbi:MAG: hypothetical protein JO359_12675 [Candidatus Eremiobacteraeota bacterium]|nr:hypothetical protein [Candidatus Eremiobacteraeota bacterium]